uniref:RING-type domain-containing protein n=1 Tax=Pyrodinium bahamense TaxID=73915 RepID=A0A7R9ZZT9_9DINO
MALAGGVAAMRAALVGNQVIVTAPGLGCLGAGRALDAMETPDAEAIRESEAEDGKPYQDFLMWPDSEEHVLYAGQFRGKLPHGTGRLFWKETQVESFVGEFRWGRLREGVFISKHQAAIGRLREVEEESSGSEARLVVAGFQPESAYDPTEPCAICLERPSILTEGRVMVPCHHGCVCSPCLPGVSECPLCRAQVSGTVRVC